MGEGNRGEPRKCPVKGVHFMHQVGIESKAVFAVSGAISAALYWWLQAHMAHQTLNALHLAYPFAPPSRSPVPPALGLQAQTNGSPNIRKGAA